MVWQVFMYFVRNCFFTYTLSAEAGIKLNPLTELQSAIRSGVKANSGMGLLMLHKMSILRHNINSHPSSLFLVLSLFLFFYTEYKISENEYFSVVLHRVEELLIW
jgi:hypothetical protein